MAAGILGTGIYLPQRVLANEELAQRLTLTPEWIFQRTGIRERRIAAPEEACSDLAIAAGRQALANASLAPDELDLIILATVTGDVIAPATAAKVQHGLGAAKAACFDLSAACSGFVYGLIVGCHLINSGQFSNIMVIGAEVLSRVVHPMDTGTMILFGDGAGAAVLSRVPEGYGLLATDMGTDGSLFETLYIPGGGSRVPHTPETLAGGLQYVRMDGPAVFEYAMRTMGDSILRLLEKSGTAADEIDLFIPHQANRRIVEAAANLLNLPLAKTVLNIEHYGNTTAASIPIALHEALTEGRIGHGSRIIMVGFGAGFSWGSCLIHWHSPQEATNQRRR